jgi:UDP-N-acetylmuramoyl-tripeptide--D-alanyl-D-alanine ligase
MTPGKFKNEYARDFKEQDYIVQPYVNSTTKEGNPFDIRIHVARGRGGKWDLVLCYALVGNKDGIVSNYTKGSGRYPNLPGFLELQFGEDWKNINKEIWRIIKTFPPELQKKRPKPIERITIDAAINRDNNNEIKFFEVDTEPNLTFWHFETAEASMHFYMYLLDMKNRSCL